MENLHLKNLIQKPNGLIILKKLKDIEHNYKNHLPADLIIETANYLETLKFKNETIEKFILEFFHNLLYGNITSHYNIPIQIITLLHKHKLNKLDIGNQINIDKLNKYMKNNNNCILKDDNKIQYTYDYSHHRLAQLIIYIDNKTNKISKIYYKIF